MPVTSTSGQGRPKGAVNKATADARAAIAAFVDGNAHRLQEWLTAVADGVFDEKAEKYIVRPDPEKAFTLFQSVIEYHVPKLARTEVKTEMSGSVALPQIPVGRLSDTELATLESLLLKATAPPP